MDQVNTQTFPFLSLPPEVHNIIYRYLLSTKYTKRDWILGPEYASPIPLVKLCSKHFYEFDTTILYMNRQVYQEGTSIFYGENLFIRLVSNVKRIQHLCYNVGLEPLLFGRRAKNFKESAMSITISQDENNRKETFYEIYACDDLHLLCRGFLACVLASGISAGHDLASLRSLSFAVSIDGSSEGQIYGLRDSMPSASSKSRRLLEPFTKLHSIDRFSITGPVKRQYKAYIKKQVARPAPRLESAITPIMALKDEGNIAFHNKQPALAIAKYETALLHLFTNFWDRDTTIQTGDFANMKAYDTCCILRFRVQSDLAAALLETQSFADCHYWTSQALEKIRDEMLNIPRQLRTLEDYATMGHRQSLASKGLGEIDRAVEELFFAVSLDPKNTVRKEELTVWRKELEVKRKRDLAICD